MTPAEPVLYQDAEVTVTPSRFQVGATMYPMRGITSVAATYWSQPGDSTAAKFMLVSALCCTCVASQHLVGGLIIGGALLAGALALSWRARPKVWHGVVVHTGGMQQTAAKTMDQGRRDAIVRALHEATRAG